MNEQYLLAVPSNTLVRDLDAVPPPSPGSGRPPKVPFQRADNWMKAAKNWTRIEVRPGEKGPLVVEMVKARVQTKLGRRNGPEKTLVIFRERQGNETLKHDYCLSNAPFDTPLKEFARVLNAEHRIEECLRRAKGEAGLRSTRFVPGGVGTIIRRSPCLPHGSYTRKAAGGKKKPRVFPCKSALDHRAIAA